MAIGIDDLDFDDNGVIENLDQNPDYLVDDNGDIVKPYMESPLTQDNQTLEPDNKPVDKDIITLLLEELNITDPTKIKFEDEEGNIEEKDWNTLSIEEQLNILRTPKESSDSLDDDEIGLINQLRLNQMSADEYIDYVKQQAIAEYTQSLENGQGYKIDDLTDDELFIADLQTRVENVSDQEALNALERAKQDLSLFEKQMKGIREEYKRIEDENNQKLTLEKQQESYENFERFKNSVVDSIQSLDKIGSLDVNLNNDDMEEVANFILSTDSAGVNYLAKALDDPLTLVRMAWFALKGEEAIDSIAEYFTEEIKKVSRERYEQGLKDGKSAGRKPDVKPSTVIINPSNKHADMSAKSINDLD